MLHTVSQFLSPGRVRVELNDSFWDGVKETRSLVTCVHLFIITARRKRGRAKHRVFNRRI